MSIPCKNASPSLEQVVKNAPTDRGARLALSAATLRDTVVSGAPFSAELDEVKSLGAGEKALASLTPFAAAGISQAPALAQELRALIPAMQKVAGAQAPAGGFLERLQANAGKLVRIRPLDAPAGDDAAAVLARLDIDMTRADIPAALADLERLDPAVRAPAQAWIGKAQARQAALAPRANSPPTRRALSANGEGRMIRIVLFLVSVTLIAVGFAWVADRPGEVAINWMGYRIETSVLVAAFVIVALVIAAMLAWSLVRAIIRSPEQVSLFFRHRRAIKGYLAISRGLIAIGAGDLRVARNLPTKQRGCHPAIRSLCC